MTAKSAYEQFEKRNFGKHCCLPLSIDSILKVSKLPDEYYDFCYEAIEDPSATSDKVIGYILKNFFGVEPRQSGNLLPLGKFSAFGGSPQTYMPDAPYNYSGDREAMQELGVTPQQLRFVDLLKLARDNSCNVLFTNNNVNGGEHVSSLDMIDIGRSSLSALYLVRDQGVVQDGIVYEVNELAGIDHTYGIAKKTTPYTPLPVVQRNYFPGSQSSWELAIFPPDPKL